MGIVPTYPRVGRAGAQVSQEETAPCFPMQCCRSGQAITSFEIRLPATQAVLAQESLKDPYLFDFLGLGDYALERDIESALVRHIPRFLLEWGAAFAFVGRQYRLAVGGGKFVIGQESAPAAGAVVSSR